MKLIKAVIREERIPFVQKALAAHGIFGMTVYPVQGRGEQGGINLQYRGGILNIGLLPKIAMEIVIRDEKENLVVSTILDAARTGKPGDGRIFVIPITESHRVRTGEAEA
ncbi:MAG: P-II family nitrogen regulator [Methanoregulaceae archaeon]|nr:P-II family nitrogen regulator [Methanoregulaceae archaeon]